MPLVRRHRGPRLASLVVALAALLAVTSTYATLSHTYDEPAHIANGLLLLDDGQYIEFQHPPLARLAVAVGPYLWGARAEGPAEIPTDYVGRMLASFDEGRRIFYQPGSYDRILLLGRLGILPFLLLALGVTYAWTKRLAGEWTAAIATLLLAATPVFLGHAGIATLDVPLAALALSAVSAFCIWIDEPRTRSALALGVLCGAAIMTKFSAIPFLIVSFAAIALWHGWVGRGGRHGLVVASRPHLKTTAVTAAALTITCWLSYGGGFVSPADPANRPYESIDALLEPGSPANELASRALEMPVVPYFAWAVKEGVRDLQFHNQIGHRSFLLGEVGDAGWWHYYLVGLGVRTPLPFLAAGLAGLALMAFVSGRTRNWRLGAPALAFAAILAFVTGYSRINLGVRHILILFPLLAIGAAYFLAALAQARRTIAVATAFALCASQLGSAVLAHPDHLAYFNLVAGADPEDFLVNTDLDWGQDVRRLEHRLRELGIEEVSVAIYGSNDLGKHHLPAYRPLEPGVPVTGWVAVSIWRLTRNDDFEWLRSRRPVERVGRSIYLYRIDDAGNARPQ